MIAGRRMNMRQHKNEAAQILISRWVGRAGEGETHSSMLLMQAFKHGKADRYSYI